MSSELTIRQNLPEKSQDPDFIKECAKVYILMERGILLCKNGNKYTQGSLKNYKATLKRLFRFAQETGRGEEIPCSTITFYFYQEYHSFWIGKGYSKNSISSIVSNLRATSRRLFRMGIIPSNGDGISAPGDLVDTVFCELSDLRNLLQMDLSATPGKERVRDLFVLHCFLGLRMSDFLTYLANQDSHRLENGMIQIKTRKTGETVWIPIAKSIRHLLEKYSGQKISFSYQYYNFQIKEIIAESPIERTVPFSRVEGGERVDRLKKFSEMVSSHTARRTFATNAYLFGVEPLDIMRITGHKTLESFLRYVRCSNRAVAEKIAVHRFFEEDLLFL